MGASRPCREKVFRDSVHGYIRIPAIIVKEVIDTPLFQRLRNIEQTSMRPLFPAARHDRFIHSLGTYHLGCLAFDALTRNSNLAHLGMRSESNAQDEGFLFRQRLLFNLACLLHDCAHAPFSHTYEPYYDLKVANNNGLSLDEELLKEYESDTLFALDYNNLCNQSGKPAIHERMSALMVRRYFKAPIERVVEHLCDSPQNPVSEDEFALIARMIIGCPYTGRITPEQSFDNCLISLLNSSVIDVDGLDYTMRDTKNSGFKNLDFDCERLLRSMRVIEACSFDSYPVRTANLKGVFLAGAVLESDPGCRENGSIRDIDGTFTAVFDNETDLRRLVGEGCDNPNDPYISVANGLSQHKKNGRGYSISECLRPYMLKAKTSCSLTLDKWTGIISGTVLLSPERVTKHLGAPQTDNAYCRAYILAYDKSSISIIDSAIDARNRLYKSVYAHPQVLYPSFLKHHILGLSATYLCCRAHLGDEFNAKVCPPPDCKDSCPYLETEDDAEKTESVGLSDTYDDNSKRSDAPEEGRHKAQICKEYAIQEVLGLSGFYNPFSPSRTSFFGDNWHFDKSDDNDLTALFKWVYLDNHRRPEETRNPDIERYFPELFSRTGKKPIWKSPEDYCHFQRNHKMPAISFNRIRGAETSLSSEIYVFVDEDDPDFKEYHDAGYKNILAIKASCKTKALDYTSTFIWFPDGSEDGTVERYCDIADQQNSASNKDFVYLFYDQVDG